MTSEVDELVRRIGAEFDRHLERRNGEVRKIVREEVAPLCQRIARVEDQVDGAEGIEVRLSVTEDRVNSKLRLAAMLGATLGAATGLLARMFGVGGD
jgi:hypothetical protein